MRAGWWRAGLALGAVVAAALLAACGGRTGGSPQPSAGGNASPGAPSSSSPAPKVANPLQPDKYAENPCGLITDAQLKSFDFTSSTTPKVTPNGGGGKTCGWNDDSHVTVSSLGVLWLPDNTKGIGNEYAQKALDLKNGYFVPTRVTGYPAVFASQSDDRPAGACELAVGINDHLEFLVDVQAGPDIKSQACSMAESAAAAAIDTLKQGGS